MVSYFTIVEPYLTQKEFVLSTLPQWEPYLIQKECILSRDRKAIKFLNNSLKVNRMHVHWIANIQRFTFSLNIS